MFRWLPVFTLWIAATAITITVQQTGAVNGLEDDHRAKALSRKEE